VFGFRQFDDVSRSVTSGFRLRHRYRIEKPLIPEPLLGTANDFIFRKGTSYKTAQMNLLLGDAEQ
jgi:hypothetical protein